MAAIRVLRVKRIGQITGTTGPDWPNLVDSIGQPLLTDTGRWNVIGTDEGANALHPDRRRTFVFFGDAATNLSGTPRENADPVVWFDEDAPLRNGGHLALGWNFQLPIAGAGVEGQPLWQFCVKCSALFWNGDDNFKGKCSLGGAHLAMGLNFSLPFEPTSIRGQDRWRFCTKCACLFWTDNDGVPGHCPADDGQHHAEGLRFIIPLTPGSQGGQQDWRFCGSCHGLFWDGYPSKGVCKGSAGGGVHLHAVTQTGDPNGPFDPFAAKPPIDYTGPFEVPNGAFFFDGRVYVLSGFADEQWSKVPRPGLPQPGQYLFSKDDPARRDLYDTEFLLSPKLGWCATDASRAHFESHAPLGYRFFLPHDLPDPFGKRKGWRSCRKCEAIFFAGDEPRRGVCQRGGPHEIDLDMQDDFTLEIDLPEDAQNQSNWHECGKCASLFWALPGEPAGLCPAGGTHEPKGQPVRIPHASIPPDPDHRFHWRFCRKCYGLFWAGDPKTFWKGDPDAGNVCPRDHGRHEAAGYNFRLPFVHGTLADLTWRFCRKCSGLFSEADDGVCPADQGAHAGAGEPCPLRENLLPSIERQADWRRCRKCAGLFYDGYPDSGSCPADGLEHHKGIFSLEEYALDHNPGVDPNMRGDFRFCVRCHGLVRSDQAMFLVWTSPVFVQSLHHPVLPQDHPCGAVLISFDWRKFRLSWMPLVPGEHPRYENVRHFHRGDGTWSEVIDQRPGYELFSHRFGDGHPVGIYTHVSAAWLSDPGCWVVLYSEAWDVRNLFREPIVARFSPDLLNWSDRVEIFHPTRDGAYGRYMHEPGVDRIHPDQPPAQPTGPTSPGNPGWPYGAFLVEKYTRWNMETRVLTLNYLMSTSSPYQVHMMETRVSLPDPIV